VGRTYEEIKQALAIHLLLGESEADVRRLQETEGVRSVSVNGFAGTAEQVTERLLASLDQGASRLIVGFADSPRVDSTQMFVEEVLPHLR
jgi:alkanesulfonate monooxygenase SsuD/methylene tetrahydromethanopterin reductase-like flavin-dependent oxidoreductase (luciferase family)